MPFRKYLTFLIVITLIAGLAGCGKKNTEPLEVPEDTSSQAEEAALVGMTVGISFPDETVRRWKEDAAALTRLFRAQGYETRVSYAASSAEQQGRDIDALISAGVNLLIISPVDGRGLTAVMGRVKEAGIPVIAYDSLIRNTDAVTDYVAFDDYMIGQMEAQYILDKLGLKEAETSKAYHIEFAAGDRADDLQGFYFNGAYDTLRPFLDSGALTVLSGEVMFSDAICDVAAANTDPKNPKTTADLVYDRMKKILTASYPDAAQLDAVLCTDDEAAAGAVKAVNSAYSGKNQVIITGKGALDANLGLIADGKQSMTVFEPTDELRKPAVALAISLMKGELPDETLIERESLGSNIRYDTETYDNGMGVIEAYLVSPVAVTEKNMTEVLVDTGYYVMSGKSPVRVV